MNLLLYCIISVFCMLYQKIIVSISKILFKNLDEYDIFKLKDICIIKKGTQLNKSDMDKNGKYYVLNGGKEPSGYTNSWNVDGNTITISEGGYCGYVSLNLEKFFCGGHCYYLDLRNKNIDLIFLFYYLKSIEDEIMKLRVGSAIKNIQKRDVENLKIKIPDLTKQEEIGLFLSALNKKLLFKKLEKENVERFKSALLQKMFI